MIRFAVFIFSIASFSWLSAQIEPPKDTKPYVEDTYLDGSVLAAVWVDSAYAVRFRRLYTPEGRIFEEEAIEAGNKSVMIHYDKETGAMQDRYYTRGDTVWVEKWDVPGVLTARGMEVQGLKEGLWENFWENGQLRSRKEYRSGKLHGTGEAWNIAGEATYRYHYVKGINEGTQVEWLPEGYIRSYRYVVDSMVDYQVKDQAGNLRCLGVHKGLLKHGRWQYYYPNGKLLAESFFEDDLPAGTWTAWYPDGTPWVRHKFLDSWRKAERTIYSEKGEQIQFCTFDKYRPECEFPVEADSFPFQLDKAPIPQEKHHRYPDGRSEIHQWSTYGDLVRHMIADTVARYVEDTLFYANGSIGSISLAMGDSEYWIRQYYMNGDLWGSLHVGTNGPLRWNGEGGIRHQENAETRFNRRAGKAELEIVKSELTVRILRDKAGNLIDSVRISRNGTEEAIWMKFDAMGRLREYIEMDAAGNPNGKFELYDDDGRPISSRHLSGTLMTPDDHLYRDATGNWFFRNKDWGFEREIFDGHWLFASGTTYRGERHGPWREYNGTGVVLRKGNYVHGYKSGIWLEVDGQGRTIRTITFPDR